MDRSEIDSLKADLRRMQARVDELETAGEEPTNRRNMLRGLGVAAAGAAVGGLAFARPAAATDGGTLILGDPTQTVQSPTMLNVSGSYSSSPLVGVFSVTNDPTFSNINAAVSCISAYADGGLTGGHLVGLWAASKTSLGIGAKLDGQVPLKLTDNSTTANTALVQGSGTYGQFKVISGDLWFCVSTSGSQRWRKLAGPASAGAFHALAPFRAYDSRAAAPSPGILTSGSSRTISIADTRDNSGVVTQTNTVPANAIAVTANVTVTGTTGGGGFLSINPGGNTSQATSAINWFGAGQNIANGLTLTLNTSRQVTVVCGSGTGSDTHFIVDISGYYL